MEVKCLEEKKISAFHWKISYNTIYHQLFNEKYKCS